MSRYRSVIVIFSVTLGVFGLVIIERAKLPVTTSTLREAAQEFGAKKAKAIPPQPFIFDGCTLFPDRLLNTSFQDACLVHDIAYWYGGSAAERLTVDQNFRANIANTGQIGAILQYPMYWGVRIFGGGVLLKPFNANWGFGYNTDF